MLVRGSRRLAQALALMFRLPAIVICFVVSLGVIASEATLRWRGHEFREITSLSVLPASIRQELGTNISGLGGVADKGKPFNVTDVVDNTNPMRRLLAAGQSGGTWLVALEQGGRAYNIQVYLFSGGVQRQHWVLVGHPSGLQAVIQQLPPEG